MSVIQILCIFPISAPPTKGNNEDFFVHKYSYINIMHQNINGLIHKLDLPCVSLSELSDKNIDIDIICITEHNMIHQDLPLSGGPRQVEQKSSTAVPSFSRNNSGHFRPPYNFIVDKTRNLNF